MRMDKGGKPIIDVEEQVSAVENGLDDNNWTAPFSRATSLRFRT